MYDEFETKTSLGYLDKVFSVVVEPVCIFGGWAIYFTVTEEFKKRFGRNYLGSRDIDLGFYIDPNWSENKLKESSFAKTLDLLENELDFKLQGFRLRKDFHFIHEKELTFEEAKKTPASFIFPLFVDLGVNETHPKFKKVFGFTPLPESLLERVFKNKKHRLELKQFKKKIWLPAPEILLGTKLHSVNYRDKKDKRMKDIIDITALMLFAKPGLKELKKELLKFYNRKKAMTTIKKISEEEKESVTNLLSIEKRLIDVAFEEFLK